MQLIISFSLLSENLVLDHLQRFLGSGIDEVDIQILQTFSMLIQNVILPEHLCNIFHMAILN